MKKTKSHDDFICQVEEYIKDNLPELQKKLDKMVYIDCAAEINYHICEWHTTFFVRFIDEDCKVILHESIYVNHSYYLDFENEVLSRC